MKVENLDTGGYIPGTCNIGKAEIKRRRNGAIFSAILTIVCIFLLQAFEVDRLWRLVVFIPAASFGISLLQWYLRFCVGFGMKGVFNFGDIGKTFSVEQEENFRKDRAKAIRMIVAGVLIGAAITIIYFLLPA